MAELLARNGRDAGHRFPLRGDVTRIGRHTENDIVLSDASVSRFHSHLLWRDNRYHIRDVGSTVGTFVNGQQVADDVALDNGDLIRIGQTELIFGIGSAPQSGSGAAVAAATMGSSSVRLAQRTEPLSDDSIALSLPSTPSTAAEPLSGKRAAVLSRVAEAIQSVSDLEELLRTLLGALFDVFRPDRGVILLRDPAADELVPKVTRPQQSELVVSRSIIDYAVEHRMCLMVTDTAGDDRFRAAASIQDHSIQAAICSPLICKDRILGAVYLDTQVNLLAYSREDLALLNLIAANAAIAVENAILIRQRLQASRLGRDELGPLVAQSARMAAVQRQIAELVRGRGPILIAGEPGTGKTFAAKTIHLASAGPDAPLVQLDCQKLTRDQAGKALFGPEGTDEFTPRPAATPRGDPQEDGALRRADGGTLILSHIGALDLASQETLARYLAARAAGGQVSPRTRVIATTSEDLTTAVEAGRFLQPLAEALSAEVLEIPPLRDRKEDVLPLAELFLSKAPQRPHEYEQELSKSARRALGSLQYRHRNVAELREAIELAAVIAEGPEIGAECIFTGPKDTGQRIEYDLGETRLVAWLSHRAVLGLIQIGMLLFFLALAGACLAAPDTALGKVANGLTWGLWWPGIMFLFLVAGRLWCPVCPISKAGRVVRAVWSLDLRPPPWMKKHTGWITAMLFLAIIWSEHVFHMTENPMATGIFLLTLMGCSVVLCFLFAREVWCRYVCPLGGLSAGYSVSSLVHVHATPSICASECKTHECFKGSASEPGCPVYHHPLYVRDAHFCKLCLACIRMCPNRSTRIYLRPLLRDVWRIGDLSATLVPLCLLAFLLILVMLASHRELLGVAGVGGFTVAACLAVAGAVVLHALLPRILSRDGDLAVTSRVALALLVLAWGPLMAFHLENIPGLDALRIHAVEGSFWAGYLPAWEVSLLAVLQLGAVFLGALFAWIILWRVRAHAAKQGIRVIPWGWRVVWGLAAIYLSAAVVLVFLGGIPS